LLRCAIRLATAVHHLASRLRCSKCAKAGRRPPATAAKAVAASTPSGSGSPWMCNLLSDCGCWHKGSARYRQPARLALVYEVDVHSRLTMVVRRSGAAIY